MKKYLLSRSFRKTDLLLLLLTAALVFAYVQLNMPFSEAVRRDQALSQGYIARESGNRLYTLDDGHTRLLCLDREGRIQFEIRDPSDNGESVLYIDDFYAGEEGLYLSASEWNGMLLDRELILRYSGDGQYLETAAENDYTLEEGLTNKHRFYGACIRDGLLTYAECRENEILLHYGDRTEILAYPNAFNAVSDLVFDGTEPVILHKNGTIQRFGAGGQAETVYTTGWAGEEDRIPFRIALCGPDVVFTDIRSGQVLAAEPEARRSRVIRDGTGSQTVTFSGDGTEMLLMDGDELIVSGEAETRYTEVRKTDAQILRQAAFLAVSVLLACAVLLLLFRLLTGMRGIMRNRVRGISLSVIAVAMVVSVLISGMLLESFQEAYMEKILEQLETTAFVVASGITEEELDGVRRAEDFGGEAYTSLCEVMERAFPMNVDFCRTAYCNLLRLSDDRETGWGLAYLDQSIGVYFPLDEVETSEAQAVYETGEPVWDDAVADVTGMYLSVKVPVLNGRNQVTGVVSVGADTYVVEEKIGEMQKRVLLSVVVMVLLIWVASTETISFFKNRNTYLEEKKTRGQSAVPGHLIRLLVFAIFSAFNMVSSFLPVYILHRSGIFPEASRELAASLPMTVNIFVIGLMSLLCAGVVRKMGIRTVLMVSAGFSLCGNLVLLMAPGYAAIVLGLVLDGIGVGLITNAVYVLLTYIPDEENRQNGFSIYNTASLAGINFGMILGGLLAVNLGQKEVFLAVALLWALLMGFGAFMARRLEGILTFHTGEQKRKETIRTGSFLRQKPIWSFITLIQNPYILFSSFVFFLVPIFCESIGYNETIVSVLLMLYSETAVLLGSSLPERMEKKAGGRSMYIALGLNVAAILLFALTRNVYGMVGALLLMGISAAFGKPCQQSFYLRQQACVRYGEDRAMGVYNFSENIGESLGPVVWGALLTGGTALIYEFLAAVTALGGAHYALNRKALRKEPEENGEKGTETP